MASLGPSSLSLLQQTIPFGASGTGRPTLLAGSLMQVSTPLVAIGAVLAPSHSSSFWPACNAPTESCASSRRRQGHVLTHSDRRQHRLSAGDGGVLEGAFVTAFYYPSLASDARHAVRGAIPARISVADLQTTLLWAARARTRRAFRSKARRYQQIALSRIPLQSPELAQILGRLTWSYHSLARPAISATCPAFIAGHDLGPNIDHCSIVYYRRSSLS